MLAGKVAEGLCSSEEEEDGTHAPVFYSLWSKSNACSPDA